MGFPPFDGKKQKVTPLDIQEKSPDTLMLNFYEPVTPVNKLLFTIIPQYDMKIDKISYNFGGLDLSANGYMQLILSRVNNPNIYGVSQASSQIILDRLGGSKDFTDDTAYFFDKIYIRKYEKLYLRLITNVPNNVGVIGKMSIYFNIVYKRGV